MKIKTYEKARTFCTSYAPIDIKGKYFYSEEQVINMLQNIYDA